MKGTTDQNLGQNPGPAAPPALGRRLVIAAPLLLLAALPGCGGREEPSPGLPRIEGYAYLTPLRLNVAELEVLDNPPDARVDPPAPLLPSAEVARMGRDRIIPSGTAGRARFVVETANLIRSGDAVAVLLRARVEVLDNDRRLAYAEAEARRGIIGAGGGAAARARVAETLVSRAMEDLNVEFEVQVRRNLRDWLLETTPTAPVAPIDSPDGIQRQDLPEG
ncbi:hypothetical protein EAH89_11135 [Roseomonas nepalensis]|uniref:Uncharacterized protein n=1 Tax=Muricoccus nepalensis TaxID=1854500 RepID=A0A502G797_9PROT|nr:hypothetical protein [Roseomonas nepalensis]TPG57471.1 hypothetical protein EAH89_11135 [Roseomonas nepalensis]